LAVFVKKGVDKYFLLCYSIFNREGMAGDDGPLNQLVEHFFAKKTATSVADKNKMGSKPAQFGCLPKSRPPHLTCTEEQPREEPVSQLAG
jgi:hypothetical protein